MKKLLILLPLLLAGCDDPFGSQHKVRVTILGYDGKPIRSWIARDDFDTLYGRFPGRSYFRDEQTGLYVMICDGNTVLEEIPDPISP